MPEAPPANPQPDAAKPVVDERLGNPLWGVRGWLLLFCVGAAILSPLFLLAEAAENAGDPVTVVFDIALAGFSVFTGISLWRVSSYALSLVKAYFITFLVIGFLGLLGSLVPKGHSVADPEFAETLLGAVRPIVFVMIWWSYFKKSQRVRLTFGRNL
jgi:hypothetical protein